eukprot:7638_1
MSRCRQKRIAGQVSALLILVLSTYNIVAVCADAGLKSDANGQLDGSEIIVQPEAVILGEGPTTVETKIIIEVSDGNVGGVQPAVDLSCGELPESLSDIQGAVSFEQSDSGVVVLKLSCDP